MKLLFLDNTKITNTTNDMSELSFQSIGPILKQENIYHYLCPKCHIFPFIEFTKSKKYIKFTCSCYNGKEILTIASSFVSLTISTFNAG